MGMKHRTRTQAIRCIVSLSLLVVILYLSHIAVSRSEAGLTNLRPRYSQSLFIEDNVIYELPAGNVVGTFFMAHACTHGANDFWLRSERCDFCNGLTEEVKIAQVALRAGYIVIAVNSSNRMNCCWGTGAADRNFVSTTIRTIRLRHGVLHLPLFAVGTSSGASFAWSMACRQEIDGVILQVLSVAVPPMGGLEIPRIPIVFNAMRRDKRTYSAMEENYNLVSQNISNSLTKFEECKPLAVTTDYLMDRLPYLNHSEAVLIIEALIKSGHLDDMTSTFKIDPTSPSSNWKGIVQKATTGTIRTPLVFDQGRSPLAKSFNRAWAFHEYCATYIDEDLKWMLQIFSSHIK